jgi:cytochrome d ubiquinol oxidase subunit II
MFETMTIETLQAYWWLIISLLGSMLVFLMFVQGGQTLIYTIGKTEPERKMLVNALGRKWEFTFTTLVTFGGAFFASFPLFYSTSFGGAYWVWMAILFPFILQAVAYEFRSKPNNFLGHKTYEWFLIINGFVGTVLIGVAVATFYTGNQFSVNKSAITNLLDPAISRWQHPWHGLEALLNWRNLAMGFAVFFLARVLGILYFMNTIDNEPILSRSKKHLLINAVPFLVCFLVFAFAIFTMPGFAVNPRDGTIMGESYKYFHNLIQMPFVMLMLASGVVFVLLGVALPLLSFEKNASSGIWYAGTGSVLTVFALFCLVGFNNTSYYPSVYDMKSSLTIHNSSSSYYTLMAMSYASLMVPFVIAYIWYAWKAINNKKIDENEMESGGHSY